MSEEDSGVEEGSESNSTSNGSSSIDNQVCFYCFFNYLCLLLNDLFQLCRRHVMNLKWSQFQGFLDPANLFIFLNFVSILK